jgi:hypothetical protein
LNVDPYEIGVVGMVILWTVNEKKGMEEKTKTSRIAYGK